MTVEEIQKKVKPVAKEFGLSRVYLFGSYARGTARKDSDVDLLIETVCPFGEFEEEKVRQALTAVLHADIDLVHMDCYLLKEPQDAAFLEKERQRYKNAVAKERVLLYENI